MGARRREVDKGDADREGINMFQGEGKERGVTEGSKRRPEGSCVPGES